MVRMTMEIIRYDANPKYGTFGVCTINKEHFCSTLEPYSRFNKKGISCIPAGQYICRRYHSWRYPNTFEIINVETRDKILFHAGNILKHTKGCVIMGQHIGKLKEDRAVMNSGKTFRKFLELMEGVEEFKLTIKEVY